VEDEEWTDRFLRWASTPEGMAATEELLRDAPRITARGLETGDVFRFGGGRNLPPLELIGIPTPEGEPHDVLMRVVETSPACFTYETYHPDPPLPRKRSKRRRLLREMRRRR
jgi:hypothetical protein